MGKPGPRGPYHFCGCSGGLYRRVSMSGVPVPKEVPVGATGC